MKRILVAGGAGFLGSHLCEKMLSQGHRVLCLDNFLTGALENIAPMEENQRFRVVERDITNPVWIGERVDEVYNLACAASPPRYQADPVHTMMTSVAGTLNLLSLAERDGARFVQASTSEVYGDPQEHPQSESYHGNVNCTGPRACYDEGKRAAEALCFDFVRADRADVRVARIFNTYGPRMQPDDGRIVSTFIRQALDGEPLTIFGDGEQTRSFCYVSDLVDGLIALMRVDPNPRMPVNLGNPGEFTVSDLAKMIMAMTGSSGSIEYRPLPEDDPRKRRPDISRALSVLKWQPRVPLEEGLSETIRWFSVRAKDQAEANRFRRQATAALNA